MVIEFEPGKVDVSTDPAYIALTSAPGPRNALSWADISGPAAVRAKQLEILEIDVEMSQRWVSFMVELVERELTDAEFTAERMLRLKLWQRERKRRQHNLHYQYDVRRRPRRLVDCQTEKQLTKQIDLLKSKIEETAPKLGLELRPGATRRAIEAPPAKVPVPELPKVTERQKIITFVKKRTPISNPAVAEWSDFRDALATAGLEDDDIRALYRQLHDSPD